jgi:hypothetical protein
VSLFLNGPGAASASQVGFDLNATNYGFGLGVAFYGCNSMSLSFSAATTGPTFTFPDMAAYAGIYDEWRIKKVWLDCMVGTNAVAPTGGADSTQIVTAPIFQIVYDPNDNTPPGSSTSLLSYQNVEVWQANPAASRRLIEFTPTPTPLISTAGPTGYELPNGGWYSATSYNSALSGFLKMYYDYEGSVTGACQGTLTIYPIIEVEWRRQD